MKVDISLDLYKIFCTVVRAGNMSEAAKALYISQPAVSMSVRQLEDRLGSPLLVRTAKGVYTTPEGQILYQYLEQALGLVHTAEEKYFELVHLEAGNLKIGASDTLIQYFLLPYLEQYHKKYPEISIQVTNQTTYDSLKLLKHGSVDLCFVNLPIEKDASLESIPCMEIQDCFVAGTAYSELAKEEITLEKLVKYPLLLLEESSNSRQYLNGYAGKHGVTLRPILELGSNDLLLSFAKIQLGIAQGIREFTEQQFVEGSLVELSIVPPIPKRAIGMVYRKGVTFSRSTKAFLELLSL